MNGDEIPKIYPTLNKDSTSRVAPSAPEIKKPVLRTPEFKYGKLLEVRQDLVNEVEKYKKNY